MPGGTEHLVIAVAQRGNAFAANIVAGFADQRIAGRYLPGDAAAATAPCRCTGFIAGYAVVPGRAVDHVVAAAAATEYLNPYTHNTTNSMAFQFKRTHTSSHG